MSDTERHMLRLLIRLTERTLLNPSSFSIASTKQIARDYHWLKKALSQSENTTVTISGPERAE